MLDRKILKDLLYGEFGQWHEYEEDLISETLARDMKAMNRDVLRWEEVANDHPCLRQML